MTVNNGHIYAVSTNNDGLDANGNMYIKGGYILAKSATTPEVALDAAENYTLYIQGGYLIAIGGLERGASMQQTCYQYSSWTGNAWYAIYSGNNIGFAFKTPTKSSSSGWGGSQTMVVSAPSSTKLMTGVTPSGTSFWTEKGYTNASGGSSVNLSSYNPGY